MKGFYSILADFEAYLSGLGYCESTIKSYRWTLKDFYIYLNIAGKEIRLSDLREIREKDILQYFEYLLEKPLKRGTPCKKSTVMMKRSQLKLFFRFLYDQELILQNPAEDIRLNIRGKSGKRGVFTVEEIGQFLDSISIDEPLGQRNRAVFELMYSSGLRIGETVKLDISDVDMKERVLIIRGGKGGKDRYIPFSETAFLFLKKYLEGGRASLLKGVKGEDEKALFLGHRKYGRVKRMHLRSVFKDCLEKAGVEKKDRSVHSIRHSTATHLLEAGADVRFVSELLGHEHIQTIVRYTHVMMEGIKRAYKSAHPRENKLYEEITEEYLNEIEKLRNELLRTMLN